MDSKTISYASLYNFSSFLNVAIILFELGSKFLI